MQATDKIVSESMNSVFSRLFINHSQKGQVLHMLSQHTAMLISWWDCRSKNDKNEKINTEFVLSHRLKYKASYFNNNYAIFPNLSSKKKNVNLKFQLFWKFSKKTEELKSTLICLDLKFKILSLLTWLMDAFFGGLPRRLLAGLKINVGGSSGKK